MFAMSINKAQGQSLQFAGIDLRNDCFSHGQLYVASSRVGSPNNLTSLPPADSAFHISALSYNAAFDYASTASLGSMSVVCSHCHAKKWKNEPAGLCCSGGKVRLPPFEPLPEPLYSLLLGMHPHSPHFLEKIRWYNSCFQMTSFAAKQISAGHFMPTFKVQGQVYHYIGGLTPPSGETAKFLQIYFVADTNLQIDMRCERYKKVRAALVAQLQQMLHEHNGYVKQFKAAIASVSAQNELTVVIRADKKPTPAHRGRFNKPTSSEIAIVVSGQVFEKRDIVLRAKDDRISRISETHVAYDALQYPLLFPRGEDMYTIKIPLYDPKTRLPTSKYVSARQFYSYHLMVRTSMNHLLHMHDLLNVFIVDMYAKIESERLAFLRNNQRQMRVDTYGNLQDAINAGDAVSSKLGTILPPSYTGSPRYYFEKTQDALAFVRHFGKPDLFITFTCNPKWKEITENLLLGQKSHHRHDLIVRVFRLKLKSLMHFLTNGEAFGPARCHMYTVEWQKRGLPHAHILLWLTVRLDPNKIDSVITAEIPDYD